VFENIKYKPPESGIIRQVFIEELSTVEEIVYIETGDVYPSGSLRFKKLLI
jgi:aconitase A